MKPKESVKKLEQNKITQSDTNNNAKGRTLRSRQKADTQKQTVKNVVELQNSPLKPVLAKHTKAVKHPAKTTKVTPKKLKSPVKKVVSSKVTPKKPRSPVKNGVSTRINPVKTRTKSPIMTGSDKKSIQRPLNLDFSFKIPEDNKKNEKAIETSVVATRPRRVSRLPSRFLDHSMSPSKFIPVQPIQASTPISQKNVIIKNKEVKNTLKESHNKVSQQDATTKMKAKESVKKPEQNKVTQSDSNYNAKGRALRLRQNADTLKQTVKNVDELQNSPLKPVFARHIKALKSPAKTTKITPKKLSPVKKVVSLKVSPKKPTSPVKKEVSTRVRPVKTRQKLLSAAKASANKSESPIKTGSDKKSIQRPLNLDFSFKILEDNKKNESNRDVYEFTFDPKDEPAPQKKKKKVVKKRTAKPKPKMVVFKNNYDQNVNKALTALKNVVAKKPIQGSDAQKQETKVSEIKVNNTALKSTKNINAQQNINTNIPHIQRNVASKIIIGSTAKSHPSSTATNAKKDALQIQENILLNSREHQVGVEDIAADFDFDINYSPVNSPARPTTPVAQISRKSMPYNNDPLNLRDNSFFEQNPVASSSINISASAQHPQPSPWRVEFEDLPLRWHVNSYVKPNMTPAVECSFVNFDNKKRHVYTNLVPQTNDTLPEIVPKDQPNLVQTSMYEFIKQQVEKNSAKKNKGRSVTPVTATLFNDTTNKTPNKNADKVAKSTRQLFTPKKNEKSANSDTVDKNTSEDKENSKESTERKRKNEEDFESAPPKTLRKENDNKYFGFDDSENVDQENVSPKKKVEGRKRPLRHRGRAVLKEINDQGPTRGIIPIAAKTALTSEVERLYNEMKSASDAPVFPEKDEVQIGTTNVCDPAEEMTEASQMSVHLFEDIEEIVHHVKPQRKSYGKAKKVTFRQASSDSDSQGEVVRADADSDADDDLADITFDPGVPFVEEKKKKKRKKLTKKQKMSKKEEEEADAWAAGFNSMCEDVEEFPLVIERQPDSNNGTATPYLPL